MLRGLFGLLLVILVLAGILFASFAIGGPVGGGIAFLLYLSVGRICDRYL